MGDAKLIWERSFILRGRYKVIAKVYDVGTSKKHPEGVKAKFVLLALEANVPRLLVDNHAPFGFHMHTTLPEDETNRVEMKVTDFNEAYDEFLQEVERVVESEN